MARDQYEVQGYCAFVGLWMLLAHILSFTSVVLWLKYWRRSSTVRAGQPQHNTTIAGRRQQVVELRPVVGQHQQQPQYPVVAQVVTA